MSAAGTIREWHVEEGWGVVDSPATPGGCWASFTSVMSQRRHFIAGEHVEFDYEPAEQDGYAFRAQRVWLAGTAPVRPSNIKSSPPTTAKAWDIDPDGTVHEL
ncbi:hypothetical protein ACWDYH_38840 [Nocardia goodfellowii]